MPAAAERGGRAESVRDIAGAVAVGIAAGAAVIFLVIVADVPHPSADRLQNRAMQGMAAAAPQNTAGAKLRASLSSGYLHLGETLRLSLVYTLDDGEQPPQDDEMAPLGGWQAMAGFDLIHKSRSESSSYTIRGGVVGQRRQVQWNLSLAPRHSGVLEIPIFEVRGHRSLPTGIPVAADTTPQVNFSARMELQPLIGGLARVGQQLLISLVVERGSDLRVRSIDMALPQLDAEVVELPRRNSHRLQDGALVHTTRYNYALFPRTAGRLQIPRAIVSGEYRQRRLVRTSDAVDLEVAAAADAISATAMNLSARWPDAPLRLGQPAQWQIRVEALGSAGPPVIDVPQMDGARQYRGNYQDRSEAREQGLAWTRTLDLSLVPRRSGILSLPAIEIPWWDAGAGQLRVARLPARQMQVHPSAMNTLAPPAEDGPAEPAAEAAAESGGGGWLARHRLPLGLALAAALALALLMAAAGRLRRAIGRWLAAPVVRRIRARLWQWRLAAAKTPAAATAALRGWLAAAEVAPGTLAQAADPALQADLGSLQKMHHARHPPEWDRALPRRLAAALAPVIHPRRRRRPALQPLYPG